MLKIITWIFRIVFLFLLYFFVFKIIIFMIKDLRKTSGQGQPKLAPKPPRSGRDKPPAELVVLESIENTLKKGEIVPIKDRVTLGRGSQNQVCLQDNFTSQEHAVIFQRDGHFWLEDLHSSNGTYINGQQINEPIVLSKGDQIKIGGVTFQFVRWEYEVQ